MEWMHTFMLECIYECKSMSHHETLFTLFQDAEVSAMTAAHKFAAPISYTGNLRGMTRTAAESSFATRRRTSAVSTPGDRLAALS